MSEEVAHNLPGTKGFLLPRSELAQLQITFHDKEQGEGKGNRCAYSRQ
jgi:hypothetical protein